MKLCNFDEFINEAKQYDIFYLADLDKEYMGKDAWNYINTKNGKCTVAEFIDAGKVWANDKMSDNSFSEEEFNNAVEYYDSFGSSNKLK